MCKKLGFTVGDKEAQNLDSWKYQRNKTGFLSWFTCYRIHQWEQRSADVLWREESGKDNHLTEQHVCPFPPTSQFCLFSDEAQMPCSNRTRFISTLDRVTVGSCHGCLILSCPTGTLSVFLSPAHLWLIFSSAPLLLQLQYESTA